MTGGGRRDTRELEWRIAEYGAQMERQAVSFLS